MCSVDQHCKGYVKRNGTQHCQVATTSSCQPGCQKANKGSVGDLIVDSDFQNSNYEGCFVKGMRFRL